jgi:ATP-dependent RNA helicase DOB1
MLDSYQGLTLDDFQQKAIEALDNGYSVVVAAPTGTGKTLVADYLIEKAIKERRRIIYTAPIKALSNQKYKDFKKAFGEELIGIMTGDIVINPDAPVLIMTTEIFRNQVITEDASLTQISYIILDEIHWLNDEERGTVWEESIILAPPGIKILGLSATIANADQLVKWMGSVRKENVVLVEEHKRAVPLEYYYFTKETGLVDLDTLWRFYRGNAPELKSEGKAFPPTTHLDLISAIKSKYLPTLYFVFSRKQCALKAKDLASQVNFLRPKEKRQVEEYFAEFFGPEEEWGASTRLLRRLCLKGIAFHHAGLLPSQKSIVEDLFLKRLIHVLYCTETFSVGINYPVKSVCFDSLEKYDGHNFRSLANHEFFQMSGRAGRRGLDVMGYSFALADLNYMEKSPPPLFDITKLEPLTSQFKLSYNTVLNLTQTLTIEQIATYFELSFASYSYTENHVDRSQELQDVEAELNKLKQRICPEISSVSCPLKHQPKVKELGRLKKAYFSLGQRRQHKAYGREMARKIRTLEKQLGQAPKNCQRAKAEQCQSVAKPYHRLEARLELLRKELAVLPAKEIFLKDYYSKKANLADLGYMRGDELLVRGKCAAKIYVQELLVTELLFSDVFGQLDDDQLNGLLSCIDFEPRKNDYFARLQVLDMAQVLELTKYLDKACGEGTCRFDPRVAPIAHAWSQGASFETVQRMCNLDEGDIISVLRRTIDLLRQMREATEDSILRSRFKDCMVKLDRDEAAIDL